MSASKLIVATALALGTVVVVHTEVAHAQASTVGQLRGQLRDVGANEVAIGATVIATSPALQGSQVVITDDTGQYFITALPPGMYTLTVYYADAKYERGNVLVQVGKEAVVNLAVNSVSNAGKPKGEIITIHGSAPILDQGSTKTGLTLTEDYTKNVPTGRTFGGTLGAASGSQGDAFGVSFGGATSIENTYVVEGINTTDTAYGQLSSNLPNEFIAETEVITGGYNAEYGRATGGIVNVVTKSGSNEFHGSVFASLNPSTFTAAAKTIQTEGGSIDNRFDQGTIWDVGFELGGPIVKDKLWFHLGFDPSVAGRHDTRLVQTQIDEDHDGVPDVDAATGLTIHRPVSQSVIDGSTKTYYFTAKLTGAIDPNNQFQISAFGNPTTSSEPIDPATNSGRVPGLTDGVQDASDGAVDMAAKWTSKLGGGKTELDAVVGYHHAYSNQSAPTAAGNQALVYYNYARSLNDFADIEGANISAKCADGGASDPYPGIVNCPVNLYQESGLGLLENRTNDRLTASLAITERVKLAGHHVIKGGIDYEGSSYNSDQHYTGGFGSFRRDPDSDTGTPGVWQLSNYYTIERRLTEPEIADPSTVVLATGEAICAGGFAVCKSGGSLVADTSDRSIGAYLQDSWLIGSSFTINAGLRYENQSAGTAKQLRGTVTPEGETVGKVGMSLDNWAPRLGFVWDPSKEGRTKVFGHWGRFYENVPMDLNVRSFGGEIDNTANLRCSVDHAAGQDAGKLLQACPDIEQVAILGGGTEYVTPHVQGQYSDELIVGAEYQLFADVKVGIDYVHRTLPMVLEDILTANGDYIITNPAQDLTQEANDLAKRAALEQASSNKATQRQGDLDAYRATQIARVKLYDKPSRNYDALQLTLTQRPTHASLINASYTYAKEQGNFPGLFSTETGQLDPNVSSEFDLPALMANRYGAMGLDRPHNLKVDGFYVFDFKQAGLVTVGASLRAQSGIPHNVLAGDPSYGAGESYVLPRGVAMRSPTTGQADVHLAYKRRLSKTTDVEIYGDVFNVSNAQQEATQDEIYTNNSVKPIVGGDATDLMHAKVINDDTLLETSHTPVVNPNYGKTTAYLQAPRSFRFGVRLTF